MSRTASQDEERAVRNEQNGVPGPRRAERRPPRRPRPAERRVHDEQNSVEAEDGDTREPVEVQDPRDGIASLRD
jgi:hypothetical protein